MWNNGLDEEDLQHEGRGRVRKLEGNWEYFVFVSDRGIRIVVIPLRTPIVPGLRDARGPFRSHNACKQVKIKF